MSEEPSEVKLVRIEQLVKDGFENTGSKLRDIIERNKEHDAEDNKRFTNLGERMGKQSDRITDLDKKVVYATGIIIGASAVFKFLMH